ncbi:MAG: T9SS type A sorting domain-containing protein [Crocinitomicaceae bacterium]|nr:T9SS type A sorting domain-containing protein [Crocinitomicaceae bacterium]
MKNFFALLLCLTFLTPLFAQHHHHHGEEPHFCHQVEETEKYFESLSPSEQAEFKANEDALRQFRDHFIANHPELLQSNGNRSISYTIPVVFHIIHAGGPENISNEQVEDCIRILNNDFQKLNNDANNVNSAFLPIVADVEIQFKLARRDPSGNCTNGITRTFSNLTFGASGQQRVSLVQQNHGNWPGDRYLNVFVAADIGGAAGYTFLPNFSGMGNGIHVLHNYVGGIGTANFQTSRTMTHEVGHWLDLPHTWGPTNNPGLQSNCDSDDGIADTPNTIGWTTCNVNGESCGSLDNVENYMEYSFCAKMFTNGQKARMHAALNSAVGGRNNVVSASNLQATGVFDPDILCRADFDANNRVVCPGQSITFSDLSFHAPNGWTWNFPGGSPSSSSDQNPTVTYNTPGTYAVTLTATDGTGSDTQTKSGFITVLPEGATLPFLEGFETYATLADSPWSVNNPGNNAAFEITNNAAHTGEKSVRLANFGQSAGNTDELISAPVDLSSITDNVTLTFRYAYRRRSNANNEWLRVLISNNCGNLWATRMNRGGNNLGTLISTNSWTPSSKEDWVTVHVTNITSQFWVNDLRVMFRFESDGGNNFFLDDINIYSGGPSELSISEEINLTEFNVFPNPADKEVNVQFHLSNDQHADVQLVNMLGQTLDSFPIQGKSGENLVLISTENYRAGVYLVRVSTGDSQQVRQIVIK